MPMSCIATLLALTCAVAPALALEPPRVVTGRPRGVGPNGRPVAAPALPTRAAVAALAPLASFVAPLAAHAEGLPVIGDFLETDEAKQLGIYLAQTLISWGVPAAVGIVFLIAASGMKPPDDAEPEQLPPALAKALGLSKEPKEYLKIERLNSKLLSFDYSLAKATISKEAALRDAERIGLERRFGAELLPSTAFDRLRSPYL